MRIKLGFCLLLLLSITACVSPPPEQRPVDTNSHQMKLEEFSNWKIKGRLAFKSDQEKFSSYLNWHQQDSAFSVKLSSTLGITLLEMQRDDFSTVLEVDDKKYQGIDASELITRVTGWNIPIASLPRWIKGQVNASDTITWTENGLVEKLSPVCVGCGDWQITFARYKQTQGLWLPHQIVLQNQLQKDNSIKIRITSWQKH